MPTGTREDLTGQVFTHLTVLSYSHKNDHGQKIYNCVCRCGKEKQIKAHSLKSGNTKSCGCMKGSPIDIIGKKIGRLTVLERITKVKGKYKHTYYLCECECGNKKEVFGRGLRAKNTISCGCLHSEMKRDMIYRSRSTTPLQAAIAKVRREYERGARRRGIEWNLSDELFEKMIQSNCHYCGVAPSTKGLNGFVYNGIDRVGEGKSPYTEDNCKTACNACNMSRRARSVDDFIDHARCLVYYQDSKKFDLLSLIKDPSLVQELAHYGT